MNLLQILVSQKISVSLYVSLRGFCVCNWYIVQGCYRVGVWVLHGCYRDATVMLFGCYRDVTEVLWVRHRNVIRVLYWHYRCLKKS